MATELRRKGMRWLALLGWMAAIFFVSDRSPQEIPSFGVWDLLVKKGGHFLAYAILAMLAQRVTDETRRPPLWAWVITAVYAASDEFHQLSVPGRNGQVADILIDFLGGVAGLAALHYWRHRNNRR